MPSVSQAQRAKLNAKFGHAWVKEHHFDNKGKLPEHVGDKKVKSKDGGYQDHGSHRGTGHSHIGAHHGGHGTGQGGYKPDPVGKKKVTKDPHATDAHHAMNQECGTGFCDPDENYGE